MIKRSQLCSEDGWVLVPVIVLMVVAIGVGFALLNVVDEQTRQTRTQRSTDSAQTLAESTVSATANVLASRSGWPVTRSCQTITGDVTPPVDGASPGSLAYDVASEIQARFSGSTPDYAHNASYRTTWRVDICPVQGTESRWSDDFLARTVASPTAGVAWVRGQASVRARSGTTRPENSRAVVSKVKQAANTFTPPANVAVGTGAFSTDVGTALNNTTSALLGGALTKPLIADSSTKIGVRCGLLNSLNNITTTCLTGALAGINGTTNALGLGALGTALGTDRTMALGTWTMAPSDVIDAWKSEAQNGGVYAAQVNGYGNDRMKDVSGTRYDCFSGVPSAQQVIFIDQVGNGDQYCDVRNDALAKILIVRKGAVRISAQFTGVVYMLNQQECTNSDGSCSVSDRTNAAPREVVRIEGNTGSVRGSVWADGAGGSVGIYPSLNLGAVSNSSLLNVGGTNGICSLPVVGGLLNTLGTTLNAVGLLVGNLLGGLVGTQEEVRYPNGATAPTGCDLLRNQLGGLTTSQLLSVFGSGGTQTIVTSEHRTRSCTLLICGAWSAWTTRDTYSASIPALLSSGTPSVIEQVAGILGATLNQYTAVTYDSAVVANAKANLAEGAGPVVGTYRNVSPAT